MKDHEEIFLQPECCADPHSGRLWCEDDEPVECEDGKPWTRYIRSDLHDAACREWRRLYERKDTEMADLRSRLAAADALLREARSPLDQHFTKACRGLLQRIDTHLADAREGGASDSSSRANRVFTAIMNLPRTDDGTAAREGENVHQVGCERDDGLLNIHQSNETCEICAANTAAREGEK
jgi:hypothetical protein